jgi:hypothetical protein
MRFIFLLSFLLITSVAFSQTSSGYGTKAQAKVAGEHLGMDFDNQFVKERFLNGKKLIELRKSLVFKEVKYHRGNSKEKRLTEKDFKKYKNPDLPTESEIKEMAKRITKKTIKNLKEQ